MTKAKQRYKNPDNIEKVYIQLRFPNYSQLNKIKRGKSKTLWKECGNLKTWTTQKPMLQRKISFCTKNWFIKSLKVFNVIDWGFDNRRISFEPKFEISK